MTYLVISYPDEDDSTRETLVHRQDTLEQAQALTDRINNSTRLRRHAEFKEEDIPT